MKGNSLWVVMPVYNEEQSIAGVLDEWIQTLRSHTSSFVIVAINDGSKDSTGSILDSYAVECEELKPIHRTNSGHGQTCIFGYKLALQSGAEWILQIDSDGQCDPAYIVDFLNKKNVADSIFGYRYKRLDGFKRSVISRFVSLFAFAATGRWVKDANVPYRLMSRSILESVVDFVPPDIHLANILVSTLLKKRGPITWVPIIFRDRTGGTASVKTFSFVRQGFRLYRQLKLAGTYISGKKPQSADSVTFVSDVCPQANETPQF